MNTARLREWLLQEAAWPDLPFPQPAPRAWTDTPARAGSVLIARLRSRNPSVPPWRHRAARMWAVTGQAAGPDGLPSRCLLFGLIAAWNEEDIIYATVRNLFDQGANQVFVLDNDSTDATAIEASDAGATVVSMPSDGTYSEKKRSIAIRELIAAQTRAAGNDVWWVVADSDEFPRGRGGTSLKCTIENLPGWVDTVGSVVIEHLPHKGAYYPPRSMPVYAFPYAHEYRNPYCEMGHWKHQLFRIRTPRDLEPMPGQHVLAAADQRLVREWPYSILMHHIPLRNHARTAAKLTDAASAGGRYALSPDTFTRWRLQQRLHALDQLYADRRQLVPNGFPGAQKTGVTLTHWTELVESADRLLGC